MLNFGLSHEKGKKTTKRNHLNKQNPPKQPKREGNFLRKRENQKRKKKKKENLSDLNESRKDISGIGTSRLG